MYEPIPLPSLEQIDQMDRKRDKAIDRVEIFDHSVKCQKCNTAVPIVGKLPTPKNNRVAYLQVRLSWMEKNRKRHGNSVTKDEDVKAVREEIAELLQKEKDSRADKRRSIPLQYWRGKYVCGHCLDKLAPRAR